MNSLQIFDNPEVRNVDDVIDEYPGCKYVMRVEKPLDKVGELLAVCFDEDSDSSFYDYVATMRNGCILHVGGRYGNQMLGSLY